VLCAGSRCDELRAGLGIGLHGHSFDDRFLICDIRTELPGWATERRFYFDPPWNPGRQVLIHPCPDSTFRIDWQVPADEDGAAGVDPASQDARIRAIIGDRPYELVWSSVYRFHSRVVDRMRVGRVLLAGDLAHLVSPFGARGLNSGVQDAENAAWKLAFVLNGWADESLLDSYHAERHAAAGENLDVTNATMRFLVPGTNAEHSHRRAVLEAAGTDAEARAAVDSGRLAEPFWYVDSPLTTPNPSHPFTGRPPRGAVPPAGPGVLVPDAPITVGGNPTRIRQIARDGFLLLAGDRVDADAVHTAARRATLAPVRLEHIADIDDDTALGARPDELWIIRPDAHVAAVLADPDPAAVGTALRRAVAATTTTTEERDHGVLPATR
jgi:pentachlorophenol monooxygenase/3-(3-hydroxy-phenyl)propionate hydroxylase